MNELETLEHRPSESGDNRQADGLTRGRRVVAGLVAGAGLMAVGGLLATLVVKSPAQVAAESRPPAQQALTVPVESRVLAQTVVTRGTVIAGQTVTVSPQGHGSGEGAGAAVVTKLTLKAGDEITAGQLLAEVSGRPVFALKGGLPVYRDLKPGATGDDVAQLQQALRELGHGTGNDPKGTFGTGTKAALTARYKAIGYEPLPAVADGGVALKQAREAVRSAEWAVEDAKAAASKDAGAEPDKGTDNGIGKVAASGRAATGNGRELTRAQQQLTDARSVLVAAEAADGPTLPASEVVFLGSFPARVSSVATRVGAELSGPVLTLSSGDLVVEAYLPEDKKRLLRPGMPVLISSETAGQDIRAEVWLVATERSTGQQGQGGAGPGSGDGKGGTGGGGGQGSSGGSANPAGGVGYRMLVRPSQALPASFTGQDVRLTVESAATDGAALVVPVTAVSAGADGRTVVAILRADGSQQRVEVRTATSGDGYVAVEPVQADALAVGARVVIGVSGGEKSGGKR
ncbi:peptidoglycan-binding protein [Streptomyces sp. NPDC059874]|uniref:peptidoglycan-binding protein n=1 Tax=Streptomyces sp. NPDC059874 TaxID=3346983 RepID=UPI003650AE2D